MAAPKNNLPAESAATPSQVVLPQPKVLPASESLPQAKTILQGADRLLHDILDYASAIIYVKDLQGRHLFVNHQFEKLFQRAPAEVIGQDDIFLFGPEHGPILQANDQLVL